MMKLEQINEVKKSALEYYEKAHIVLTDEEKKNIEVADFGLNDVYVTGLELVTYINTEFYCAKEMVLFPHQTCPEHIHASIPDKNISGKKETFRCRYGTVYLYVEGEPAKNLKAVLPQETAEYYTAFHEIELHEGEQYTINPNTRHWFQSGNEGAVISEFSTTSYDEYDIFTNPNINRITKVVN